MNGKKAQKQLPIDIEIIIGMAIALIGAVILVDFYGYMPKSIPIPRDLLMQAAGISCVVSGLLFAIKKLFSRSRGFSF